MGHEDLRMLSILGLCSDVGGGMGGFIGKATKERRQQQRAIISISKRKKKHTDRSKENKYVSISRKSKYDEFTK